MKKLLTILACLLSAACNYSTFEPGRIMTVSGPQQAKQSTPVQLDIWAHGGNSGAYTLHEVRLDVDQAIHTVKVVSTLKVAHGGNYPQMVNAPQHRILEFTPQNTGTYHVVAENFMAPAESLNYLPAGTATPTATIDIEVTP